MNVRLGYNGGVRQIDRMNKDKLISLKRALLYSYQSATMRLDNKDEFRCLINPDKTKLAYDDKILSVPFEDTQLNDERKNCYPGGICKVNIKPGDTFEWKENHTHWIVYARRYEETAYFRAEIRECKHQVEIDEEKYWVYLRGPEETTIQWNERKGLQWNNLNYDLLLLMTKNKQTEDFFHRFTKIKILDNMWEVQAVDSISSEGIIKVCLKEDFNNTIHELAEQEKKENEPVPPIIPEGVPYIEGEKEVSPYDTVYYVIKNADGGVWSIDNPKKAVIVSSNGLNCKVNIISGKSGEFTLTYSRPDENPISITATIKSL